MKIILCPQVKVDNKIWYEIEEGIIHITVNDITETYDFRDVPEGVANMYDEETGEPLYPTEFEERYILDATKEDGELTVEILFSIEPDETDERLLFPEPMTLDEFHSLMDELKEQKEAKEQEEIEEETEEIEEETEEIEHPVIEDSEEDVEGWDDF